MPHKYLGPLPRLAIGVRLPDIVIPPVLKAFKDLNVAGTLMLSYHRETGPADVVANPPHPLLAHTGTSISEYIRKAINYADEVGVLIEVEADHVSLMASPERAIKRITEKVFEYGLSEDEIRNSLNYIEREFREVKEVGGVDFVTVDTCELIDLGVEGKDLRDLSSLYEEKFEPKFRRELESRYLGKVFKFFDPLGRIHLIKFSKEDVIRLSLKYLSSVSYVKKVVDLIREYVPEGFGIEVALDEVPELTKPKDLIFYLSELRELGINPDFIAPNIGFKKREDFDGDLRELKDRVATLHAIATSFGALLSIHSGSGSNPYSDKGRGTWPTLREVTGGMIKYKVSGVYIQLLLEVMASFPEGSGPQELFSEIFNVTLEYLRRDISQRKGLYSPELAKLIEKWEESGGRTDPRADFFRHYFFVFQAVKDPSGRRYLREKLLNLFAEYPALREKYFKEAFHLTSRMVRDLGLSNNLERFKVLTH